MDGGADASTTIDLLGPPVDLMSRDAKPLAVDLAGFDASADSKVRCVEGWPSPKHTVPSAPLQNVGLPRVLWEKTLPAIGLRGGIALSGGGASRADRQKSAMDLGLDRKRHGTAP